MERKVLLVGGEPAEWEALHRGPLGRAARQARDLVEARADIEAGRVNVLICDLAAFAALEEALDGAAADGRPVSQLVLVSPGEEESAAARLAGASADFLPRAGSHVLLLRLWLERARRDPGVSREELGRVIRHEINNPLTGVLGNAELILAEARGLAPGVRNRLTTIIQLAVRMRDVVRTLEERLRRSNSTSNGPAEENTPVSSSETRLLTR